MVQLLRLWLFLALIATIVSATKVIYLNDQHAISAQLLGAPENFYCKNNMIKDKNNRCRKTIKFKK